MTIEDIYGDSVNELGLPNNLIAASMGKVSKESNSKNFKEHDVMMSMLIACSINIGQLTNLLS